MSLTEEQIERYARQILLPTVGGAGQERLLASVVDVAGDGLAARTAETYLRVAGSKTRVTPGPRVGLCSGEHRVRIFARAVGFASDAVCPSCSHEATELGPPPAPAPTGADAVLLGALAAALMQRLMLGQGPARGQIHLDEAGGLSARELPACTHGGAS